MSLRGTAGERKDRKRETAKAMKSASKTLKVLAVRCMLCWEFFAAATATGANNQFCNHTQTILLMASIFPLSTTTFFITMQQQGYLNHDMRRK
jgi:hypothetical protein